MQLKNLRYIYLKKNLFKEIALAKKIGVYFWFSYLTIFRVDLFTIFSILIIL